MTVVNGSVLGFARVTVKNFGHSPAISLFVKPEMTPLGEIGRFGWSRDLTAAICLSARDERRATTIQVVFPDEVGKNGQDDGNIVPVRFYVSAEQIAQAKKGYINRRLTQEKDALGVDEATKERRAAEAAPFETAFTLAGCVTYFSFHGLVGQTSFAVDVYRRIRIGSLLTNDERGFDASQDGDVPPSEINVTDETLGGIDIR